MKKQFYKDGYASMFVAGFAITVSVLSFLGGSYGLGAAMFILTGVNVYCGMSDA